MDNVEGVIVWMILLYFHCSGNCIHQTIWEIVLSLVEVGWPTRPWHNDMTQSVLILTCENPV